MADLRLRPAREADVTPLLALINGYAERQLLLRRSEESLRARLRDFLVAERDDEIVGCGALSELGPGLGEVRSLAVRSDQTGRGVGHALVERLVDWAGERGFTQVLSLTRRVSFFEALGFQITDRRLFEDKLRSDCQSCPLNVCCDETALVQPVRPRDGRSSAHPIPLPAGRGEDRAGSPDTARAALGIPVPEGVTKR